MTQDYVGPDGVARRRSGLVASLRVEPYETQIVLPHERTHAGPKESRLRLLRPRARSSSRSSCSTTAAAVAARRSRAATSDGRHAALARPGDGVAEAFAGRQLLIADGHHRYETALAYAEEEGTPESARMMVVLVSTSDPGLEIFPTHRLFRGHEALPSPAPGEFTPLEDALAQLAGSRSTGHRASCTAAASHSRRGEPGELDVELVEPPRRSRGSGYSADAGEAVARVDAGEFDGAFLLRATRIEDVFERARRGEVMPQKTTYFFPKLTSGLLFHPRMTVDWPRLCRDCVADIAAVLGRLPTRVEREPVLRAGEGGDDTTAIDAAAEEAVVARLEALGTDFTLVSEELGVRHSAPAGRSTSSSTRSTGR